MFDFQSFDGMVPTTSTWLPRPQLVDGHRLSMVESEDGIAIVDELIGTERRRPSEPAEQRPTVAVVTYGRVGYGRTWGGRRTLASCIDPLIARRSAPVSTQTPLDRRLSDANRRKH